MATRVQKYNAEYYQRNKEKFKEYYRTQIERFGIEHRRATALRSLTIQRTRTFERYGGVCVCCGESNRGFLTFDHIDGKEPGGFREAAWREAKRKGYPDTFRILCFNCNCGRSANGGVCPHKEK